MEFLSTRRPDMDLKPGVLQQLSTYERRLAAQSRGPLSSDWSESGLAGHLESEELMLRNTYLNSQMGPLAEFHPHDSAASKPPGLAWADAGLDDKVGLER